MLPAYDKRAVIKESNRRGFKATIKASHRKKHQKKKIFPVWRNVWLSTSMGCREEERSRTQANMRPAANALLGKKFKNFLPAARDRSRPQASDPRRVNALFY